MEFGVSNGVFGHVLIVLVRVVISRPKTCVVSDWQVKMLIFSIGTKTRARMTCYLNCFTHVYSTHIA